jgi:hypothetical protein
MKTTYSRRELYAAGEFLGDSATRRKANGGYILGGGGGGSPPPPPPPAQPTQTTVQNTNIPEYARPYVETMLGATQQQLFNTAPGPDGTTQITGIKPYEPYSTTAADYIAGFSPLQTQAQQGVGNLAVPGAMAAAGMGSLGAGANYQSMATNPRATAAYMSPYMQNAVDVQKTEALRDAQMRNVGANLGAARQGTYGGARQVLAEQERNRNLQSQLANIQATGTQNAFQAAQQAQQYGAGLGLQGYGQAANIAGQQLQAEQGILGLQSQFGAQQQQQQQNIINQAIQNYAVAQQYPQQQLAFMNAQLRGLPLQSTSVQQYQAPPSQLSQVTGMGLAGLGAYKAFS